MERNTHYQPKQQYPIKISQITETKWSKAPVGQRSLSKRENKELRQKPPSSSPLEKDKAVQAAFSAKAKRADRQMEKEILEEPAKEKQHKEKKRNGRKEGIEAIEKEKLSVEELEKTKRTQWREYKNNVRITE